MQDSSVADVNHLSHKLAGSSLACGLSAIVPPLRKMEHNAKAGHLDNAKVLLSEAARALEQLRKAVQVFLSANAST